ncbi:outer membrane protein assembly factor BamA [Aliikangiella coralliicola]|uniref:Outer membrane protein assembly factor BamA n=1 Tax=Aliikangiella coralliicola TaxID=2592383 RepID=A0A545UB05_9GAMM|nr:outer membrane protein assembly factor BamA [Aliikangiella coralliicola]TQV86637.1 outer membrane protein assembly factor BamA [Aliikangiella coralliicola]
MKYNYKSKTAGLLFGIASLGGINPHFASAAQTNAVINSAKDSFVVEDIDVAGLQRMELGTFFNLLPLQVGETLDPSRIPIIIRAIYSSNSFEDVRLFRDGNKLFIDLKERPTISSISIEGNSDIESEQILDAMRKSGFAKGEVFDPSAIKSIKIGIEEQYFAHGKYSVKIDDKIIKQSRNRVYVKFEINEGDPAKIQRINVVGNHLFSDEELLDQFELSVGGWLSSFSGDDQYSREKLSGDLETLRSYYLDRGYLTYNNTSTQVSISPDRKGIYVTINVDEGEKFTVDDIVFSGELILTKEQLKAIMPLTKGDTYSAAAVSFAEEQIKESLGYYGYAFAKVVTVPNINEEENKVELTLYIDPGKKVYVSRINFLGNETTNDEVLRREVRLMEGGALSTSSVERSKLRLQRLSYLEEVEVETPKVEDKDDRVDVNYRVKERSAGTISGGVGYSDTYKLSLNANVSHNNFLGSGKRIQFGINKSKFVESYNLDYLDPYFTINGISAGVGAYLRETDYGEINLYTGLLDSVGIDFNLGYPINEVTRLNFGIGYQDNELKARGTQSQQVIDFFESNGQDVRADPNFSYNLYRFNMGWIRNTLNRGIFPDRGTSQNLVLNATVPGSDLEYYKLDYTIRHYIPIAPKWTFLSSFRASWGDGYGDTENLPYFENFNAGGSGTMRGFDTNTIGPRLLTRITQTGNGPIGPDPASGSGTFPLPPEFDFLQPERRSAGGNARVLGTLELIFPVPFGEDNNSLRTSFFVDAGNLWDTKFNRDKFSDLAPDQFAKVPDYSEPGSYRVSAGFSLQWLSPMGPLTISLSKPIKKEENDETENFSFNVGKTF